VPPLPTNIIYLIVKSLLVFLMTISADSIYFWQYSTTSFSNTLPTGHKIVTLSHPANDHLFAATLRKRTGNTGLALISGPGWKDFVKHYGFQLGDLVVLSIRLYLGRLLVRVFRLPIVWETRSNGYHEILYYRARVYKLRMYFVGVSILCNSELANVRK